MIISPGDATAAAAAQRRRRRVTDSFDLSLPLIKLFKHEEGWRPQMTVITTHNYTLERWQWYGNNKEEGRGGGGERSIAPPPLISRLFPLIHSVIVFNQSYPWLTPFIQKCSPFNPHLFQVLQQIEPLILMWIEGWTECRVFAHCCDCSHDQTFRHLNNSHKRAPNNYGLVSFAHYSPIMVLLWNATGGELPWPPIGWFAIN